MNGMTSPTITVTSATRFTIPGGAGNALGTYTADTGRVTSLPEIGDWEYAFALPSDYLAMVKVFDELSSISTGSRECQFSVVMNIDNDGLLLLTNDLTNADGDGVFIEYVIDQTSEAMFSEYLVECIATLLAAELCPVIGRDLKTRNAILLEYEKLSVPQAQAFNQGQLNNYSKIVPDYLGGRG